MKNAILTAAAISLAVPFAARADDTYVTVQQASQSYAPPTQGGPPPMEQRRPDYDSPPPYGQRYWQARQGLLLSFGLGGGAMYLSTEDSRRVGAFDGDFRLGYGFSDRFQLFMDLGVDAASFPNGDDAASWTWTLRGQTVLVGDRRGNGLNVNFGLGIGGVTYNSGTYYQAQSSTGLALAGGVSYSARLSPFFALEPEFFINWHQIPNPPGYAADVSSVYGLKLNFTWYLK
jgi:hypothetical protein